MVNGIYDVGPERRAYEAVWTDELQSALIEVIRRHPSTLWPYLRSKVTAEVEMRLSHKVPVGANDVVRMVEDALTALNSDVFQVVPPVVTDRAIGPRSE